MTEEPNLSQGGGVPAHIAVIMDGNRRWAKARRLPAAEGHRRGARAAEKTAEACAEAGVRYLTLYAFSTENSKRDPSEVAEIMNLLRYYLKRAPASAEKYNGALSFIGDAAALPEDIRELLDEAERAAPPLPRIQVNIALQYGARDDIIRAARKLYAGGGEGGNGFTADALSACLDTAGKGGDPDLLIRTGGEQRLSNFLLWQCAYTELYFTDTLWPDFDEKALAAALSDYAGRIRRYGL